MIEIEILDGKKWVSKSYKEDRVTIGRSKENVLTLRGMGISRRHAVVYQSDKRIFVRDLDSKNGTYVNQKRIAETEIHPGDLLEIGPVSLRLRPEIRNPFLDESTFVRDIGELTHAKEDLIDIFMKIANLLTGEQDLNAVAGQLLDAIGDRISFNRAIMMLWSPEEKELIPAAIRSDQADSGMEKQFSSTISKKAFEERVGILTSNAMMDPRFSGKESIMIQGIRSAMCVPMWDKENTIGVIYLDSLIKDCVYSSEDLKILSVLASFAAIGISQIRLAAKMRQEVKLRQWLSRYHSPAVVSRLITEGTTELQLKVEEAEVSVMFCDIVGFTPLSRRLAPAEVASLLNFFFSEMTDLIFKYHGTLDKFIGDAIMGVFGAPNHMPDHADNTVRCAVEIHHRLQALNRKLRDDRQLEIRIGINSGMVVAGDIGSEKRMEYTVLGDTVNVASRIESAVCKPGGIVIGKRTWELLKDKTGCVEIGKSTVKGVPKPISVYEVNWKEIEV
ncbi:MAG: FHA domain-containing protein [Acidobacteria bacterium]|nr:FHA domain-containing protein [Acidobacteriota bacterium]